MSKQKYIIWDTMDELVHRGPWTKEECIKWLSDCTDIFGVTDKQVAGVFKMRRFYTSSGRKKFFVLGTLFGFAVSNSILWWDHKKTQAQISLPIENKVGETD